MAGVGGQCNTEEVGGDAQDNRHQKDCKSNSRFRKVNDLVITWLVVMIKEQQFR